MALHTREVAGSKPAAPILEGPALRAFRVGAFTLAKAKSRALAETLAETRVMRGSVALLVRDAGQLPDAARLPTLAALTRRAWRAFGGAPSRDQRCGCAQAGRLTGETIPIA
jgi:hypothetical protein